MIKLLLYDFAREHFFANLDLNVRTQSSILCIDKGHTHTLIDGNAVVTCGYLTNRFLIHIQYSIAVAGDSSVKEFYTNEFLGWSFSLLLSECLLTDKLLLVEFDEHPQTSHNRRNIF